MISCFRTLIDFGICLIYLIKCESGIAGLGNQKVPNMYASSAGIEGRSVVRGIFVMCKNDIVGHAKGPNRIRCLVLF